MDFILTAGASSIILWDRSGDQSIRILDLESRQVIKQLHGPTEEVYDLEYSPDNKFLVATSKDRSTRIYDVQEKRRIQK